MHIPDGYLSPSTCAVLYAAAATGWYSALKRLKRMLLTRVVPLISVFAAFSFVVMMFNLPLPGGTTGHALGVTIATIVLGPSGGILAISIALVIQALFFGDGGISTLGANCFNMAIIGSLVAYGSYRMIAAGSSITSRRRVVSAAIAGYLAVNAAALVAAIEFGIQPMLYKDAGGAPLELALQAGSRFARIYSNNARQGKVRAINLYVEAIPHRIQEQLEAARLVSGDIVRPGDTVTVEATVRPWHQPARNVRIPVKLPARLGGGNLRILVSDAGTLDRTLEQPRFSGRPVDLDTVLSLDRHRHASDRIYVSVLVPETQAGVEGQTMTGLPLSVANALEPLRSAQDLSLNGESASVAADAPAGGVLSGFQILTLHIEPGGGLN